MRTAERRHLIILTALLLVVLGAFAAEATLRNRTCISGQTVTTDGTVTYPTVCTP